jgi:hypothetical protein
MFLSAHRLLLAAAVSTLGFSVGCLSEQPKGPLNSGGAATVITKPAEPELPPDNPEDVAALKAANSWMPAASAGSRAWN